MGKREEKFFEWYEPIQQMADKHGVTIYQIVNAREIWDFAYTTGKSDGLSEAMSIVKGENNFGDAEVAEVGLLLTDLQENKDA
jgi:hypothetical protein